MAEIEGGRSARHAKSHRATQTTPFHRPASQPLKSSSGLPIEKSSLASDAGTNSQVGEYRKPGAEINHLAGIIDRQGSVWFGAPSIAATNA
jgi:hypothetical protein